MFKASRLAFLVLFGVVFQAGVLGQTQRTVYVSIKSSKYGIIKGLQAENFKVLENKLERKIVSVSASAAPMSIGFLFDISGSMMYSDFGYDLKEFADSIEQAIRNTRSRNQYFLTAFDRESYSLADWTSDPDALKAGFQKIKVTKNPGYSYFLNAMNDAIAKFESAKSKRKLLIVFTDGDDTNSYDRHSEVTKSVELAGVSVHFVTPDYTYSYRPWPYPAFSDSFLAETARATGGQVHVFQVPASDSERRISTDRKKSLIQDFFRGLFEDFESEYTVTYENLETPGRTRHRLDVKIDLPPDKKAEARNLKVRFPERYRTPN